jgi:hypothetical protein
MYPVAYHPCAMELSVKISNYRRHFRCRNYYIQENRACMSALPQQPSHDSRLSKTFPFPAGHLHASPTQPISSPTLEVDLITGSMIGLGEGCTARRIPSRGLLGCNREPQDKVPEAEVRSSQISNNSPELRRPRKEKIKKSMPLPLQPSILASIHTPPFISLSASWVRGQRAKVRRLRGSIQRHSAVAKAGRREKDERRWGISGEFAFRQRKGEYEAVICSRYNAMMRFVAWQG